MSGARRASVAARTSPSPACARRTSRTCASAARAEAQKILQAARSDVDNRIKHARHELTEYAGELAAQRAENILREKITDEDRRKLFAESVHDIEEASS